MDDLIDRLCTRAAIRRKAKTRKSVQEGKPDKISDLLEEAADALRGRKVNWDLISAVCHRPGMYSEGSIQTTINEMEEFAKLFDKWEKILGKGCISSGLLFSKIVELNQTKHSVKERVENWREKVDNGW